jgi:hypothetical protein
MTIKTVDQPTIILFFLPILTLVTFNVVGTLMLSDVLVAILTPILFFNKNFNKNQPYLKTILLLLLLWLVSAITSDILNSTSLTNMIKGSAAIIFFGFHIFVIFVLANQKEERLTALILGTSISFLLLLIFGGEVYSFDDGKNTPWKMGVGFGVTLLIILYFNKKINNERNIGKILLLFSPIHLFLNARSLFLIVAITGFITAFQLRIYSRAKKITAVLIVLIIIFFVVPVSMEIYGNLTQKGFFGVQAQEKYMMQTAGGEINILLAGRSESLISLKAISDSPIFGHGSWAESKEYFMMYLDILEQMGRDINWDALDQKDRFLIPGHSMLLSSWLWHGILASLFWFYILYLSLRVISLSIAGKYSINTRDTLITIALIWDIFFSPFGQARRCIEVVYILTASLILHKNNQNKINIY